MAFRHRGRSVRENLISYFKCSAETKDFLFRSYQLNGFNSVGSACILGYACVSIYQFFPRIN
jgi:hypothetical protein